MEYFFSCPYCWEKISMVLDTSVRRQSYVEDCEVCCHPIQVRYSIEMARLAILKPKRLNSGVSCVRHTRSAHVRRAARSSRSSI